jgi:hypothetical protein
MGSLSEKRYGLEWTVCFVEHCLSFCHFSFGHCVICPSSIYGIWLYLWYLQILLVTVSNFNSYSMTTILIAEAHAAQTNTTKVALNIITLTLQFWDLVTLFKYCVRGEWSVLTICLIRRKDLSYLCRHISKVKIIKIKRVCCRMGRVLFGPKTNHWRGSRDDVRLKFNV